ncbi:YncE family protein [Mucilaginibacter auburnensis]|uniref:YVTN family beta-propeller protein n=1 Tax=Mucilaginibacter auburnensis TaxID=1457233 RepID=A0A2H9VLB2_9SPHI|nr:DUF5074 domain-containing protein [Mucilaginibacter auburnensis]PJJ79130.1 YVTN family beta-propeller protein [Mucilaginibacter auburnensis]
MKQFKRNYLLITLAIASVLASCSKNDPTPDPIGPVETNAGAYVLNQGGFGHDNSTLTYFDYATRATTADIYLASNANTLGDTGNDLGIYGSKMYIVVNNSGKLNITNKKTAKLIRQINIYQPRYVVFYGKNAFVDSYDGTVSVIDTTSLTITKTITVGRNPEQMAISNGKLYVANSGGLDVNSNFDKTVSVIDLATLSETKKINVTVNPVSVVADRYNNVYVLSIGDYGQVSGGMTVINANTDEVRTQTDLALGYPQPLMAQGDFVFYATADKKIAMYNARTQTLERASFITDGTNIGTPYAFAFDSVNGLLFVTSITDFSSNGKAYAFNVSGQKQLDFTVGINPGKIAFVTK